MALRIRTKLSAVGVVFICCARAFADEAACATNPHDSNCGLESTLHLLRVVAVILAVLLVGIVVVAYAAYRKNQHRKLTPDE